MLVKIKKNLRKSLAQFREKSRILRLEQNGGFLKKMVHSAIVFPLNRTPWGLFEADLFAKTFLGGGLIRWGLFGGGGLFEDLRHLIIAALTCGK